MPCSPEIISQNCWLYMRTSEREGERKENWENWKLLTIVEYLGFLVFIQRTFLSTLLFLVSRFFCAVEFTPHLACCSTSLWFSNHDIWLHRWLRAGARSKTQWNGKLEDCLERTFHFTVHEINESDILDSSKIWRWKILIKNYELWTSAAATTRFCIIDTMHRALSRWNELSESISNGINQWKLITDILHHTTEPSSSS